jgi:DNA-binding transcriptional MerR regulator
MEQLSTYGRCVSSEPKLLTTSQLARALSISRRTLARYAEQGLLQPAFTLPSGQHRWDLDDIRRQLAALRRRDQDDV